MAHQKERVTIDDVEIQKHVSIMQNALSHLLQLRNQSEQHASIIGDILCDTAKQTIDLIKGENISNQQTLEVTQDRKIGTNSNAALFTESQRLNNYGLPMTVLEMQVDDMLTHGVHSVLPHYVYYKERTKLDVTPDGVRRSKLKKDNALEHLQRYFSLYLQYFTSNLADGENPLYLFQLGKIDQKLYRALFDFSSNYPDQLPQISKLIPNEFDRGNNLLKNESVSANAVATFYWAKRYRSNKRNINDT